MRCLLGFCLRPVGNREEAIRDAFITGLLSNAIRQRLLKNKTLDLGSMFSQARALDSAQKSPIC